MEVWTTHYPSWGFGTRRGELPPRWTFALITPHGDLEPPGRSFPDRRRRPHYPSWGFGTRPAPFRTTASAHYPSWGFGTRRRRPHRGAPAGLITPHGDLEPGAGLGRQDQRQLITPHGDLEPGHQGLRPTQVSLLITPHGDLEPAVFHAPLMASHSSLPLMGIWNPSFAGSSIVGLTLITPHGDLELHVQIRRQATRKAHYPSWGFGTSRRSADSGAELNSLPLMGIWNVGFADGPAPPRQDSLPLMGIWNLLADPLARLIVRSLPLMGIWNLPRMMLR